MLDVNFSKTYKNRFSLNVEFSTVFNSYNILLGPSGAGKSLTLKIISGFEKPENGYVKLKNIDITGLPPERRKIVYLPQNLGLFPHLTVEKQLHFPFKAKKSPIDHKFLNSVVKEFSLGHLLNSLPRELSGGERQRVALARSLISRPDVLLLDEPLSALDFHLKVKLMKFLGYLKERFSLTIIHVTHDPLEAFYLGEFIHVIQGGRIIFSGNTYDFLNNTTIPFIREMFKGIRELYKKVTM